MTVQAILLPVFVQVALIFVLVAASLRLKRKLRSTVR